MGKWTNLKDSIPAETKDPSYSDQVRRERESLAFVASDGTFVADADPTTRPAEVQDWIKAYNDARDEKDAAKERDGELNLRIEALTTLITKGIAASGFEKVVGNGYSFSEKVEPYASVADKGAVLEHFLPLKKIRTDLEALLKAPGLKRSDLAEILESLLNAEQRAGILSVPYQTLNGMVKAEAEAGDLTIETVKGENGQPDQTIVKATIPGVNVFLKTGINRRKA